ncbi:unnamed protein product [Ilex paraguariensis]|uniref:Uncharacterized protein n=1 Tax=Ilex paraguariensis TaxID=185542 RepID=A0ABC8TDS7_9AQUA
MVDNLKGQGSWNSWGCQSIVQEYSGVDMLLKKAETLNLLELEDVETVLNDIRIDGFSNLKALTVARCGDKIKYLVDTKERMPRCVFPAVEKLYLSRMQDLRQICHGHLLSTSVL